LDLGSLLKNILEKLCKQLNDPPFNYMIHSAPFGLSSSCMPYTHWFLQIVPQLSVTGGFEMGSGCYINPVFPEDAAKILREIDCSI
jgi:UDPglucose--hexose-1-phosphate uridylyltransferase